MKPNPFEFGFRDLAAAPLMVLSLWIGMLAVKTGGRWTAHSVLTAYGNDKLTKGGSK